MKWQQLFYYLLLLLPLSLEAIIIDQNSSNIDLLKDHSSIYITPDHQLSLKEIEQKRFIPNHHAIRSIGFAPHHSLWIKFKLTNSTNHQLKKILEYAHPLTQEIYLFDRNQTFVEGSWHISANRLGINPTFEITLNPKEERLFYIKAHSTTSTTIAQLRLWSIQDFIEKENQYRVMSIIFFTILLTLLIYNLFIYFFTKDRAYLYYIIYLLAIVLNEAIYSGLLQRYLLSSSATILLSQYMILASAFLVVSIVLFTREFLQTKRFKKLDKLLQSTLYLVPLISLLSSNNLLFDINITLLFFPIGGLIIFVAIYALLHGVKEAKFYLMGWSIVIMALLLTNLQTLGIVQINESVKYLNSFAYLLEIFLFSIALAHRIKILNEQLYLLQHQEQKRLQKLVESKTQKLKASLQKEEILYRELNHRVKNNFQMILSLIKLQILQSSTPTLKSALISIQDRINAIAHLYEILNIDKNHPVETKTYFRNIIQDIQQGFTQEVQIIYNIQQNIDLERLLYCGLILNELVTNSFKYAFKTKGVITISLYQKNTTIYFEIEDNGKGYSPSRHDPNSLGLLIVQTLVEKQLFATLQIDTKNGVKNIISWDL
jgi:two-component sensor histidine kinase